MSPQPHDPDVKALLRIAVVWNIPIACNRASADFMIASALMTGEYERLIVDYQPYRERQVEALVGDTVDELEAEEPSSGGLSEPELEQPGALP